MIIILFSHFILTYVCKIHHNRDNRACLPVFCVVQRSRWVWVCPSCMREEQIRGQYTQPQKLYECIQCGRHQQFVPLKLVLNVMFFPCSSVLSGTWLFGVAPSLSPSAVHAWCDSDWQCWCESVSGSSVSGGYTPSVLVQN